ncbi:hypothetical protein AN643_02235 [Candidatus Epulonipiscioides saccharophilum]|nr:hypothetical protein AN643_02235 [Epulopiscium sp. SCG-B10WGA-EpuloB]
MRYDELEDLRNELHEKLDYIKSTAKARKKEKLMAQKELIIMLKHKLANRSITEIMKDPTNSMESATPFDDQISFEYSTELKDDTIFFENNAELEGDLISFENSDDLENGSISFENSTELEYDSISFKNNTELEHDLSFENSTELEDKSI